MAEKVRIALAKGDGIGPEIMDATLSLLNAAGVDQHVDFTPVDMGSVVWDRGDTRGMTDEAIEAVESCGLLFKGPMATPTGKGGKSINVTARKLWGTFANLREFQYLPGVETVYSKAGVRVHFYVVRENVEDTYGGIEHRLTGDVVECKRIISAPGSDQVHRFAFREARKLGIPKIHCGHKANIMKLTDGMFLNRFKATAEDFPDIETDDVIIDALCMNLVQRPSEYKMVVLPNLQGDIVSDLAAGLVGGLGFAPSANIGRDIQIYEAVHGTAPDIAGKGVANPSALILSSLMMLRSIGLLTTAATVGNALLATLEAGARTGDFGNPDHPVLGTVDFTQRIIDNLGKTPTSIDPLPVPGPDQPTPNTPDRPNTNTLIQTFQQAKKADVGCDVFIEGTMSALELAQHLNRLCEDTIFKLTLISNRGTQVWPSGSVYTDVVDHIRARFELRDAAMAGKFGQEPGITLFRKIAEKFDVIGWLPLRTFDGAPGYSAAQGQ